MNRQQQDLSWASLPKEARDKIRSDYSKTSLLPHKEQYELGVLHTFENIFGHHKLNSDTEPEEMLMVDRNGIKDFISENRAYKGYDGLMNRFPEDLIPERTDWHTLQGYADGLYYLIQDIKLLFLS